MACYSVTKVVAGRRDLLRPANAAAAIAASLGHLRSADRIKLFAFCVMPDHVHFAFCLMPGEVLAAVVASFSKHTARVLNRELGLAGSFWQNGFHDHRCRNSGELLDLCDYIEHNPVRAGFVTDAAEWAFSSASAAHRGMLDREWWP